MLCFLITCLSFIFLVSNPLFKSLPAFNVADMQILPISLLSARPSSFFILWVGKGRIFCSLFHGLVIKASMKKKVTPERNVEQKMEMGLLDLPDLVLECLLERLSPAGLCSTAIVCRSLREKCSSDYLWEKHMKQKWGRLLGPAAYEKWQSHIASQGRRRLSISNTRKQRGLFQDLLWRDRSKVNGDPQELTSLPAASIMDFYSSLETGKFWFPAQVYNRENGHVGFMLSCYDAEVCYDMRTDTFTARYGPRGGQTIEENIEWKRLRKPAVGTAASSLHDSDCLDELKPNDYVEIQWRKSTEFPYGWWFAVVGHLESCNAEDFCCQCQSKETVVLEFKQYALGSQWRRVFVNRKDHRWVGNERYGFYGGIRKLYSEEEISTWKHFWKIICLE